MIDQSTLLKLFLQNLPEHKCSFRLTHNVHKDYYQTAAEYLSEVDAGCNNDKPDFDYCTADDRVICTNTDEIWEVQWYPHTPIGFCHFAAPTLQRLFERMEGEK